MLQKIMHTGNIIIAAFVFFAIALLWLVFKANSIDVQYSVQGDYYARETEMNAHIQAQKEASALRSELNLLDKGDQVLLSVPPRLSRNLQEGRVEFYCVPSAAYDVIKELKANDGGAYYFDKAEVLKGKNYVVKVSLRSNNKEYYKEFEWH